MTKQIAHDQLPPETHKQKNGNKYWLLISSFFFPIGYIFFKRKKTDIVWCSGVALAFSGTWAKNIQISLPQPQGFSSPHQYLFFLLEYIFVVLSVYNDTKDLLRDWAFRSTLHWVRWSKNCCQVLQNLLVKPKVTFHNFSMWSILNKAVPPTASLTLTSYCGVQFYPSSERLHYSLFFTNMGLPMGVWTVCKGTAAVENALLMF